MRDVGFRRFDLYNYFDVWGNTEDGWEVNNLCKEFEDLVITDDATDQDIINCLYDIEFINTNDLSLFEIEDMGEMIEISEKETQKPLCSFRAVA